MISLHDFVAVISSQSEGLGKMALGIVKIGLGLPFSANRRCLQSVCLRSVGSRSVVVDLLRTQFAAELKWLFITLAAAFRFCKRASIILVYEK